MLSQILPAHLGWAAWLLFAVVLTAAALIYSFIYEDRPYPNIPIVGQVPWDFLNMKTKERFVRYANEVLAQGLLEHPHRPFQVNGANGPLIILPPRFANEIRHDPRLSFTGVIEHNFFPTYPGLDIFSPIGPGNDILQTVVRKHLSGGAALDTALTPALSDEMRRALASTITPLTTTPHFPSSPSSPSSSSADATKDTQQWQPLKFFPLAPHLTARVSSRAFLGAPLCRDAAWLDVAVRYTVDAFFAVRALRTVPPVLRAVAAGYVLPEMRVVREEVGRAREVVGGEVEKRRRERLERGVGRKEGEKEGEGEGDAIAWFDEVAGGREYDIVREQLMLSVAAIHTTSVTLVALLYDLAENPEWIGRVREEVVAVLREDGGWKRGTLGKMRLLDSCMKESQRLHTVGALSMNRRVEQAMTLSDGTHLPRGALLGIPTLTMRDPVTSCWGPTAPHFIGDRFLKLREQSSGAGNRHQFVSTSADHMGFGYGRQACPGRFFAAAQIKVSIVHLLLNFDWRWPEGKGQPQSVIQSEHIPDPEAEILFRRRVPEIDLL
ncbi:cytochrome p450 [Diplodia corticola]|uniref:Cytochrome p450 n=1 Tax=Diplodia corticola TaxID=236234 RepID=A0A1J9S6X2_9PEZI|nr:cytochrome p450 [Diplodia corticola]OJD40699.1 cytochrome p450 [Diplodia corticola]